MKKFLCIKNMFYDDGELGFISGKTYTMNKHGSVIDESGEENLGFDESEKEWVNEHFLEFEYDENTMCMKPNWKIAPEWANWYAIDKNGACTWFENKPTRIDGCWDEFTGRAEFRDIIDWEHTLEQRPSDTK